MSIDPVQLHAWSKAVIAHFINIHYTLHRSLDFPTLRSAFALSQSISVYIIQAFDRLNLGERAFCLLILQ